MRTALRRSATARSDSPSFRCAITRSTTVRSSISPAPLGTVRPDGAPLQTRVQSFPLEAGREGGGRGAPARRPVRGARAWKVSSDLPRGRGSRPLRRLRLPARAGAPLAGERAVRRRRAASRPTRQKEMAWCASAQLKAHGACHFRFSYGVFPRCSLCPLFERERAISRPARGESASADATRDHTRPTPPCSPPQRAPESRAGTRSRPGGAGLPAGGVGTGAGRRTAVLRWARGRRASRVTAPGSFRAATRL